MSNIFKVYKSSAWQEPEDVKKYSSSAWEGCESVKRYKDGAWTEIWSAMELMQIESCTLVNGALSTYYGNTMFGFDLFADQDQRYGSLYSTGSLVFIIYGSWSNPTVSMDYYGGLNYLRSYDSNIFYQRPFGTLSIGYQCGGTSAGSLGTTTLGSTDSTDGYYYLADGTISKTISKSGVTAIRLTITPTNYVGYRINASNELRIFNLYIDGVQYGFTPDVVDYTKYLSLWE